jgi:hypothetical protein
VAYQFTVRCAKYFQQYYFLGDLIAQNYWDKGYLTSNLVFLCLLIFFLFFFEKALKFSSTLPITIS